MDGKFVMEILLVILTCGSFLMGYAYRATFEKKRFEDKIAKDFNKMGPYRLFQFLLHEYETTRGLWAFDMDPWSSNIDMDWIRENSFKLKTWNEDD